MRRSASILLIVLLTCCAGFLSFALGCAKPTALLRELVKCVEPGGVVFDPFGGSGTTGVAAAAEGRNFVCIEREGPYVEISQDRTAAELAQGKLF